MSPRRIICYRSGLTEASSTVYGELKKLGNNSKFFCNSSTLKDEFLPQAMQQ